MTNPQASARVLRFAKARGGASSPREQGTLMDTVYTTGALPVAAEDVATKRLASRLHLLGFFQIEEVGPDGSLRRLLPSQSVRAEAGRPWRVSRARRDRGARHGLENLAPAL